MSAIDAKQVWPDLSRGNLDDRYEKCRNITEEIYKRINITFQIKKLETGTQSDDSDQSDLIDSNELSNETDLFACDKSSISSSSELEAEAPARAVNINNNEEKKKAAVSRRPRKRFRKRVKKRPVAEPDSDASSDSAAPLSRMLSERVVPNIVIITKDAKPRIKTPERKPWNAKDKTDKETRDKELTDKEKTELKACTMCSLCFRGERGLRRHMNMTHITPVETRKRDRDSP
ncbi:uncharacterized protein LOC125239059 [Leguminivora glycinivorella]|uniref:uncharacterized protein LOC125239059 n=1 Tax=Leguminivora glycinivorella TaxID=1035111 RepID=UPI00200BCFD1|nr:uncharacterized protein LOC125239059 [Leguminivora glycinivorella]